MKKYQQWLIGLLLLQGFLTVSILAYGSFSSVKADQQSLLAAPKSTIDRLIIRDATQQVELKKVGGEWQLPEVKQLPVDTQKIDELLAKLDMTKLAWPVTNTSSSHERFEVIEAKYQRHVEYFQGDKKLGDFYIGTSPGFKTIHLRKGSDTKVYAVALNQFDFVTNKNDWLSKALISATNIVAIKSPGYELRKSNSDWAFVGNDGKPDTQKVEAIANGLQNLQALEVVADAPKGEVYNLSVNSDKGELQYSFVPGDNTAFVRRSDRDFWFKINLNDYNQIVKPKMEELLSSKTEEKPKDDKDSKSDKDNKAPPKK